MKLARPTLFFFGALALAARLAALPQPATPKPTPAGPPRPTKVASVEGITEYVLGNGLHVLLFPDPTKPTITVNLTYLVGSRQESYGETGMAHLLEHLMFKGTPKHGDIYKEIAARGGEANASTWYDRTNYYGIYPASDENLEWALELEADRMVHSFIAKKDLDSEMTVVRNEFEAGENDPDSVLAQRVLSTAYLWHNYGKDTIGSRADIENVPIERLQAFWRTYYQPDNAYLLIAGRFDEASALARINRIFGVVPRPKRVLAKTYTEEPAQDGERRVLLQRVGDVQALAVAYHVPSGPHPDSAAIDALGLLLTDAPSGRLYKALVETKKAASVSDFFLFLHDPGFLMFQAQVRKESSLDDAEKAMLATLDEIRAKPITAEEVERVKTKLLKNIDLTLNSADRVGIEMSEWIGAGDWRLFFLNRDRVRALTAESVQRVAAEYLKPSNRTVGLFLPTAAPDRAEVPATPEVAGLVKDYKGDKPIAQGEAFDASPANIESRTTRTKLPNGLKVALLPKKTRGATVVVSMTVRFGDEKSLVGKAVAADLAGDMLMRGTTKHTRQQLKDEFDRLKARVGVSGGATQASVGIETVRESLPAVLALVAEVLREPAWPAGEFDQLKQENYAAIEQRKSEPESVAINAYTRRLNPYPKGDVRYVETPDEALESYKAATLDDVRKFHSDYYGASVGELALVGDFDPKETMETVTRLFGDWKSPRSFERVPRPYQSVAAANDTLQTPDKANAFYIAGQNLPLKDDDADYPALVLGDYMLGGGFLNSRFATRVRQKEGLSYGVGSQISASPLDASGSFVSYAIYAPQNAGKLETAMREELDRVRKDGFTEAEVAEAKKGYLQGEQVSRAQDASLARALAAGLYLGRTLYWNEDFEKRIAALTPADVTAAMRKHVDPAQFSVVKAGDFAKASSAAAAKP
jgi:zinc protease